MTDTDGGNGPRRALLVGASRGLGLGVTERLLERGWHVTATVRRPTPAAEGLARAAPGRLRIETGVDVDDDAAVAALRARLDGEAPFDLLFVVAGVATQAGTPAAHLPRDVVEGVYRTNAVSPIRFAEAFHRRVAPGGLIAFMSSRHGSVSANNGGGWESYRASKAALNTLARSFKGRHGKAPWGVVLMHPGWVRTDLGGRRATLDVVTSVRGTVEVLERRMGSGGCVFLDYKGEVVPW